VELRKAEILFKDEVAGTFEETAGGGTRFVYGADWKTPIACCLRVLRREHEWPRGVHPFFQQLGPEGWLREEQARVAHIDEEDDFGLLLRYGADCIGAVGFRRPEGAGIRQAARPWADSEWAQHGAGHGALNEDTINLPQVPSIGAPGFPPQENPAG
jgi:HipA-like protein